MSKKIAIHVYRVVYPDNHFIFEGKHENGYCGRHQNIESLVFNVILEMRHFFREDANRLFLAAINFSPLRDIECIKCTSKSGVYPVRHLPLTEEQQEKFWKCLNDPELEKKLND